VAGLNNLQVSALFGFKLFISIHSRGSGIGVDALDEQAVSAGGPLGAIALKHTRVKFEIVEFELEFELVELKFVKFEIVKFKIVKFKIVKFEFVEFEIVKFEIVKFKFESVKLIEFEVVELTLVLLAAVELATHEKFVECELAVPIGRLGPRFGPVVTGPPTVELEPMELAVVVLSKELPDTALLVLPMELADIVVSMELSDIVVVALSIELVDIALLTLPRELADMLVLPGWSCKSCLLPRDTGWKKSP